MAERLEDKKALRICLTLPIFGVRLWKISSKMLQQVGFPAS